MAINWQPIETAPRDGTYVLLAFVGAFHNAEVGSWRAYHPNAAGKTQWRTTSGHRFGMSPTHWLPIPPVPKAAS